MVEGTIAPTNKFLVVLARVLAVGMHQGYADVVSAIITAVALGRHDGLRVRVAPAGAHLASRIPAFLHELLRSPDAYSDAEHGSRLDWTSRRASTRTARGRASTSRPRPRAASNKHTIALY